MVTLLIEVKDGSIINVSSTDENVRYYVLDRDILNCDGGQKAVDSIIEEHEPDRVVPCENICGYLKGEVEYYKYILDLV